MKKAYLAISYSNRKLFDKEVKTLAEQYSKLTKEGIIKCPWVNGAESFIKNNYTKTDMYIVSGTPQDELDDITKQRKMAIFFKGIYGAYDEKYNIITEIVNKNGYKHVVYIGDQLTDYMNAKKAKVDFIGLNNDKIFPKETRTIKNFIGVEL